MNCVRKPETPLLEWMIEAKSLFTEAEFEIATVDDLKQNLLGSVNDKTLLAQLLKLTYPSLVDIANSFRSYLYIKTTTAEDKKINYANKVSTY